MFIGVTPPPFRGELGRELEQLLEGCVDVLAGVAGGEAEAERAVVRIDGHRRRDPKAAEDLCRALAGAEERRCDLLVDRLGQLCRQLLLRRSGHHVDLSDQHAFRRQLLRRAPDER